MIFPVVILAMLAATFVASELIRPSGRTSGTGPPDRVKTGAFSEEERCAERYDGELLDLNNPYRWDNQ